jgi:hypothetical protein
MIPLGVLVLAAALVPAAPASGAPEVGGELHVAVHDTLARGTAAAASWLPMPGGPDVGDDWEADDWDWVDQAPPAEETREKSALRAVASSALLPGLGERYVGSSGRANFFHITEAVIWSTFAYYHIQADVRRTRHIEFAEIHGGAAGGQDEDYYEHIGLWLSLDEWQDIVRRDARLRFPDDPAAQEEFFEKNRRYDDGQDWNWPDDEARTDYRRLRSRTERSLRNARMALGAAVFNRLASMVDALALTRAHNNDVREQEQSRLDLRIGPKNTVDGLVVGPILTRTF